MGSFGLTSAVLILSLRINCVKDVQGGDLMGDTLVKGKVQIEEILIHLLSQYADFGLLMDH